MVMRHRGLRPPNYQISNCKITNIAKRGYMLITLMLALALITIGLLTVLPEIGQQIRRDREDEMRHRGTAYMRAIQHFYKKFGRYPMRVEELENTNNLRFLRKRYKDPINRDTATGQEKDFKLLHQTDITLNNGPVLGTNFLGRACRDKADCRHKAASADAQGGLGGLQGGLGGLGAQPGGIQQTGNAAAPTPASGDSGNPSSANSGNSSSGDASDTGEIRIRLDRRLRVQMQIPIPAQALTDRRSAEGRSLGVASTSKSERLFACSTTRTTTTTGSSFTCRRLTAAAC